MDEVEVQVRYDPTGKLNPVEFRWRGQTFFLHAIGRRWKDGQGLHILVQAGQQVYELLYQAEHEQWWLAGKPDFPPVA